MANDDPFLEEFEDERVSFGEAMWFVWGVLLNSGVSESGHLYFFSIINHLFRDTSQLFGSCSGHRLVWLYHDCGFS